VAAVLALFIESVAILGPNLILVERADARLPMVLDKNGPDVAAFVPALAPGQQYNLRPARPVEVCLRQVGETDALYSGTSLRRWTAANPWGGERPETETRRAGAAGRSAKLEKLLRWTAPDVIVDASTHPARKRFCWKRQDDEGLFPGLLSVIAASASARGAAVASMVACIRLARGDALARELPGPRLRGAMSPTPWATGLFYRFEQPIVVHGGSAGCAWRADSRTIWAVSSGLRWHGPRTCSTFA